MLRAILSLMLVLGLSVEGEIIKRLSYLKPQENREGSLSAMSPGKRVRIAKNG
jgi:hypothetical protein